MHVACKLASESRSEVEKGPCWSNKLSSASPLKLLGKSSGVFCHMGFWFAMGLVLARNRTVGCGLKHLFMALYLLAECFLLPFHCLRWTQFQTNWMTTARPWSRLQIASQNRIIMMAVSVVSFFRIIRHGELLNTFRILIRVVTLLW